MDDYWHLEQYFIVAWNQKWPKARINTCLIASLCLILVFYLIGWENGAGFLGQSPSQVKRDQCIHDLPATLNRKLLFRGEVLKCISNELSMCMNLFISCRVTLYLLVKIVRFFARPNNYEERITKSGSFRLRVQDSLQRHKNRFETPQVNLCRAKSVSELFLPFPMSR